MVVLNMSKEMQTGPDVVDVMGRGTPRLLVSTIPGSLGELKDGRPMLEAWEGRVYVNATQGEESVQQERS